jgi:hypothetical protein
MRKGGFASRGARFAASGLVFAWAAGLAGCREFEEHRAGIESMYAAGRYDEVARTLDDPKVHELYGSKSELLWKLDRGATALALGQNDQAIDLLEQAEKTIELQREQSTGDVAASWILNDAAAKYIAEPYEDMYVNVVKIMAQFAAGRIDGGASVEARRLAFKSDILREQYVKYEDAIQKQDPKLAHAASSSGSGLVGVTEKGRFVESTLGTYLAAMAFMESGNLELQEVAARRLQDSIRLEQSVIGPVKAEDFSKLESLRPRDVNVLVVALCGRAPTKYARRVGPIPLGTVPIYFELPYLRVTRSRVARAHLEVEGSAQRVPLAFVEDMSLVAEENHKRMLPLIYARTFLRVAIKAGASATATEVLRKSGRSQDTKTFAQVGGVVAGLIIMYATERADVRCWAMLPGQAHVAATLLPAGEHRVRVVYEGVAGGTIHASEWKALRAEDGGLSTIVTSYWD